MEASKPANWAGALAEISPHPKSQHKFWSLSIWAGGLACLARCHWSTGEIPVGGMKCSHMNTLSRLLRRKRLHCSCAAYLNNEHVSHFRHVSNFCLGKRAEFPNTNPIWKLSRQPGQPGKRDGSLPYAQAVTDWYKRNFSYRSILI